MIPKVIHYCWFGKNPLSDMAKKCIESWQKYCPDYQIVEWNESNFDLNINDYVKEAYQTKKWAFVTDFVRLYILYKYGGIYMDTDVEMIKNIDILLEHSAFSGFESNGAIPTGILASESGNEWIGFLLTYYNDRHFIKEDGNLDCTTNVITITNMTKQKYGSVLKNKKISICENVILYPSDYFCPKDYDTGVINCTENTYVIHHFNGSWLSVDEKNRLAVQQKLSKIIGGYCARTMCSVLYTYKSGGMLLLMKKIIKKFRKNYNED